MRSRALLSLTLLFIARAGAQYSAPSPIFSRLFGGSAGSDAATGLAVDANGDVALIGTTSSPDFPVTGAAQPSFANPPLAVITPGGASNASISAVNITALAASKDNSVFYAASQSGVYRSTNQGATWTRQNSTLPGATSLAVDGGNPGVVYAAVVNVLPPGALNGLFKSIDSGVTWSQVSPLTGALFTPAQLSGVVYLFNGGIFLSTNGGSTWSSTISPHNYNVFAMALAPSDPPAVYTVASDGLLYKSSDGGSTWTAPGGSFTAYPNANASLYVTDLAVDSQNENIVWVLNHAGTLWRSSDGGATFAIAQQTGNNPQGPVFFSISGNTIVAGQMLSFDGGNTWQAVLGNGYYTAALATPGAIFLGDGGSTQGFLTKWSSSGSTMLFSTFLPASGPIASDSAGNTWVAAGAFSLLKFDPSGKQLVSQSLDGQNPRAIAVDPSGNVYITAESRLGDTGNCDGPASLNASIPQVIKFDPQGNLVYWTSFPQLCYGTVYGIAVDAAGSVYLAGNTTDSGTLSLPTTPTSVQPEPPPLSTSAFSMGAGFLAIVSPSGTDLSYLSYLGGSNSTASGVAVDLTGNVYVTGTSPGASFPFTPTASFGACAQPQTANAFAFVIKLNPASSTPLWTADLNGACGGSTTPTQISLDPAGDVWIGGTTSSGLFPTLAPFELQGRDQGFLSQISPDGEKLLLSSYSPGPFALGAGNTLYLAGAEVPNPPKGSPAVLGQISSTSALVESFNLSGSQASVIDAIPSLETSSGDPNSQVLGFAPGELIQITGRGLGPTTALGAQIGPNGRVATSLGGISVLFNGVAAPLLSLQENLITCMAPFELDGQTAALVQIQQGGATTPGVLAGVKPVTLTPEILAVVNDDGTLNSQSNPAHAGQPVIVYVSGFGDTNPSVPDGSIYQSPLPTPLYPLEILGSEKIAYAGAAPGMVAGIWQVNLSGIPQGSPATVGLLSSTTLGPYTPAANFSVWVGP